MPILRSIPSQDRLRRMPSRKGAIRTALGWSVGTVIVAVALTCAVSMREHPHASKEPLASDTYQSTRGKMGQVVNALAVYCSNHAGLPVDVRGPEYALYELHTLLEPSCFDLWQKNAAAAWDHEEKKLVNGDIWYLNKPCERETCLSREWSWKIVLMALPKGRTGLFGSLHGIWESDFEQMPDRRMLGCWRTVDDFYVVGDELYSYLKDTHVVPGHQWSSTYDNGRLRVSTVGTLSITYMYRDGKLDTCDIKTSKGRLIEKFETDDLGLIKSVERSPMNWKDLLR